MLYCLQWIDINDLPSVQLWIFIFFWNWVWISFKNLTLQFMEPSYFPAAGQSPLFLARFIPLAVAYIVRFQLPFHSSIYSNEDKTKSFCMDVFVAFLTKSRRKHYPLLKHAKQPVTFLVGLNTQIMRIHYFIFFFFKLWFRKWIVLQYP